MTARLMLASVLALAAAPALAGSPFDPTYQSLYSEAATSQPVPDGADASAVRRDGYAEMSARFAREEAARAAPAKQRDAALAQRCCCAGRS